MRAQGSAGGPLGTVGAACRFRRHVDGWNDEHLSSEHLPRPPCPAVRPHGRGHLSGPILRGSDLRGDRLGHCCLQRERRGRSGGGARPVLRGLRRAPLCSAAPAPGGGNGGRPARRRDARRQHQGPRGLGRGCVLHLPRWPHPRVHPQNRCLCRCHCGELHSDGAIPGSLAHQAHAGAQGHAGEDALGAGGRRFYPCPSFCRAAAA
mmetsp:Transcript_120402/g.275806  ORF Transcript_120402/g.275806 Transcript_120402/m.275806 type:complete len:206 (+) Transcript_120402:873-1490(+)